MVRLSPEESLGILGDRVIEIYKLINFVEHRSPWDPPQYFTATTGNKKETVF